MIVYQIITSIIQNLYYWQSTLLLAVYKYIYLCGTKMFTCQIGAMIARIVVQDISRSGIYRYPISNGCSLLYTLVKFFQSSYKYRKEFYFRTWQIEHVTEKVVCAEETERLYCALSISVDLAGENDLPVGLVWSTNCLVGILLARVRKVVINLLFPMTEQFWNNCNSNLMTINELELKLYLSIWV